MRIDHASRHNEVKAGDTIKGDEWRTHEALEASEGFSDSAYPGCQFRYKPSCTWWDDTKIGINVVTTGKPRWNGINYQSRCKIEVVGDGEPSTFFGGIVCHVA